MRKKNTLYYLPLLWKANKKNKLIIIRIERKKNHEKSTVPELSISFGLNTYAQVIQPWRAEKCLAKRRLQHFDQDGPLISALLFRGFYYAKCYGRLGGRGSWYLLKKKMKNVGAEKINKKWGNDNLKIWQLRIRCASVD